ncbi:uncharacterized protein LOC133902037 [Phragmites australis]|uniref:uncharacterized protein LOC133902037 n=1 Tax=Phragmites australis TaxID=29695 RepID=UPI002D7949C4|nr:uncharacterized protein LOC133902037 [Phragmites australis]
MPTYLIWSVHCLPHIDVTPLGLNKKNVDEDGNRVIMPQSALDRLGTHDIEYPMLFQIQNPSTERDLQCGMLEFIADEGFIHVQSWLMAYLGLMENDIVAVRSTSLPKATFVKLQPHTTDFLVRVSHPRDLLEHNFRKYPGVTAGETIIVTEAERRYYLDVVEARSANAVCAIDTDCEVDFAPPLDCKEQLPVPEHVSQGGDKPPRPVRFTGVAARMDGKLATAGAVSGGSGCRRFG